MQDSNSLLLILQSGSMTVALTLTMALIFSRFHNPETTKDYELVRTLITIAMFILVVHYGVQIAFGLRAQGDDVGALINMLFYSPVLYILSYSTVRIGCGRGYHHKYIIASSISLLLIIGCFLYGYWYYGSLHMTIPLYAMGLLFFCSMLYFTIYPMKEIKRVSKRIDEESGQEPVQYNIYMRTSIFFLNIASFLIPFSIFYTPILAVAGPFYLTCLIMYVVSFIALGFNIRLVRNIISDDIEDYSVGKDNNDDTPNHLSKKDKAMIKTALETWNDNRGYNQSDINSASLAMRLNIQKGMLVQYIREVEGKTFRVWLSDIRINAAKKYLRDCPNYSISAVAEACGFTSRTYLQNKFKEVTGLTPTEWREANKE